MQSLLPHGFLETERMLGLPEELRLMITWWRRLNEAEYKKIVTQKGSSGMYYLSAYSESYMDNTHWHEWVVEIVDGVYLAMTWEFHNWKRTVPIAKRYESGNRIVQTGSPSVIFSPKHEKIYWTRWVVKEKISWVPDTVIRVHFV